MNKERFSKIIISLDGTSQESYEKYRVGGNYNKVIDGIRNLKKAKLKLNSKYPRIVIQFLVFKHNEHEIPNIRSLAKDLKVDKLELKTAQIYSNRFLELVPQNKKYSRYLFSGSEYVIKKKIKNRCFRIWSVMVITWDTKLIPCCFDKNNQHIIGNIIGTNTLKLWKSDSFNRFRLNVLKNRSNFEICGNCNQ